MGFENRYYRNWPATVGVVLAILSLLVGLMYGFSTKMPGQAYNWIAVINVLLPGFLFAGIFLAIGSVISRLNELLSRTTTFITKSEINKLQ